MTGGKISGWLLSAVVFFTLAVSPAAAYRIDRFDSVIEIGRDTTLSVSERIEVYFETPRHGLIRTLPVIYRSPTGEVNSRISQITVTDATGAKIPFSVSRAGDNLKIKIGDPDKEIAGQWTYRVSYAAKNILQRYPGYDELYWNAVGSDWDVAVASASATVISPFAPVAKSDCFDGCQLEQVSKDTWQITSIRPIPPGFDLTFVLGFDPENKLVFPHPLWVRLQNEMAGILVAFLPALIMGLAWWRRGRDYRFINADVYSSPVGGLVERVSPFHRDYLPLVYSPIAGLTPAEAGTILDLRVDLADVTAEITELARLGFITIHRISINRRLLPDDTDYIFVRTQKSDTNSLKDHQKYLLDSLFNSIYSPKLSTREEIMSPGKIIDSQASQLSKMSGHFYADLNRFREKLYQNLTEEQYFGGRPDHLQAGGIFTAGLLIITASLVSIGVTMAGFGRPAWVWLLVFGAIAIFFGYRMGYRTAAGYALYRQLTGLKYFLGKGKWRYDIAEKHLFLEEILPLAISLGVVEKLSRDMAELEISPPQYVGGMSYADMNRFSLGVGRSLATGPAGTSQSSRGWSGGSGFSGGRIGGGFGGGGGRSW